ncbi:MAG TPA: hypothetical protein VGG39_33560 [Polyangiaceae bacterium]|jgi:hypothetical protein
MMRRLSAVAAGLAVLSVASVASAQRAAGSFGDQGQFILSADRLFPLLGYSHASETEPNPPAGASKATDSESYSNLGFFYGSTPAFTDRPTVNGAGAIVPGGIQVTNFYTVPRVGFDYTIIPNLTIGGDLILFFTLGGTTSHEVDNNAGGTQTTTASEPTNLTFGIAPRVGYILHFSELFSLWLRGGLSFYTETWKQSSTVANQAASFSANYDQLALDLEPQLVITPIQHVGFTAALDADIPLTGGHSYTENIGGTSSSVSAASNIFFIGGTVGMLVWF